MLTHSCVFVPRVQVGKLGAQTSGTYSAADASPCFMDGKRLMNELLQKGGTKHCGPDVAHLKQRLLEHLKLHLVTQSLKDKVENLAEVLALARVIFPRSANPYNVTKGFAVTGLEPPNFDVALERVAKLHEFPSADIARARAALPRAVEISKKNGMLTDADLLALGVRRTPFELSDKYKDQDKRPLRNQWSRRLMDRRVMVEHAAQLEAKAAEKARRQAAKKHKITKAGVKLLAKHALLLQRQAGEPFHLADPVTEPQCVACAVKQKFWLQVPDLLPQAARWRKCKHRGCHLCLACFFDQPTIDTHESTCAVAAASAAAVAVRAMR